MYLNETTLIGNVGKDPVTAAEGKKPFAMFDLALSKQYTPKGENAKKVTETHWHKIVCYGNLAEIVAKLIHKGSRVLVSGELENTEWTDKEGQTHKGYRILANKVLLLDKKNDSHNEAVAEE